MGKEAKTRNWGCPYDLKGKKLPTASGKSPLSTQVQ
jgi:hypothetical protein